MIFEIIALIIVLAILFLILSFIKNAFWLLINSIIGFFALYGVNVFLTSPIPINFWSVIIIAIGGVFGLIVELILHFFGVAF